MRQKYENERKLEQHIFKTYYADAPAHDSLKCTGPSCRMFSLKRKQLSSYGVKLSVPPGGTYVPSHGTYIPSRRTYVPWAGIENMTRER